MALFTPPNSAPQSTFFRATTTTVGITALNAGTQANSPLLTTLWNRVDTVGAAGAAVVLPPSNTGDQVIVTNNTATNAMNLFPAVGESINLLANNTAFSVVTGGTAICMCMVAGNWIVK